MESSRKPICPKCRGVSVSSNKIHNPAHHGHTIGHLAHSHPIGLLATAGLWLAGKAINALNHEWKCACGHEFSGGPGACVRCTGTSEKMYDLRCCGARVCTPCINDVGSPHRSTCELCHKPLVRR
jgi:hypothetical protein